MGTSTGVVRRRVEQRCAQSPSLLTAPAAGVGRGVAAAGPAVVELEDGRVELGDHAGEGTMLSTPWPPLEQVDDLLAATGPARTGSR